MHACHASRQHGRAGRRRMERGTARRCHVHAPHCCACSQLPPGETVAVTSFAIGLSRALPSRSMSGMVPIRLAHASPVCRLCRCPNAAGERYGRSGRRWPVWLALSTLSHLSARTPLAQIIARTITQSPLCCEEAPWPHNLLLPRPQRTACVHESLMRVH